MKNSKNKAPTTPTTGTGEMTEAERAFLDALRAHPEACDTIAALMRGRMQRDDAQILQAAQAATAEAIAIFFMGLAILREQGGFTPAAFEAAREARQA